MIVAPGSTFEVTAQRAMTGQVGVIGVRILDGQGGTTLARTTAGIVESPPASGIYTATLIAPTAPGQYLVVWDMGAAMYDFASEEVSVAVDPSAALVRPGDSYEATVEGGQAGLVGTIGFQVLDGLGNVIIPRTTSGIVESSPGIYTATFSAPPPGQYVIAWDMGTPGSETASEDLVVSFVGGEWRPSVTEVALLLRTRTVGTTQMTGGLGADTGPVDMTTFDDTTRPTASEVEAVIDSAAGSVFGYITGGLAAVPEDQYGAVRNAIALYAAVLIEVSFFRDGANQDLIQLWRDLSNGNVRAVNMAIQDQIDERRPAFGAIAMTTDRVPPVAVTPTDYVPGIDY